MKKLLYTGMLGLLIQGQAHAQVKPKEADTILKNLTSVNAEKLQCTTPAGLEYVCEDMAKLSCKPGRFDDGTGVARSNDEIQERFDSLQKKAKTLYQTRILQILNDPGPQYAQVRRLAMAATNQSDTPDCISKDKTAQSRCYAQIAALLGSNFAKNDFRDRRSNPIVSKNDEFDFATLEALKNNLAFSKALAAAKKDSFKMVDQSAQTKRIETEVFPRVRKLIIDRLAQIVPDQKTRAAMIDKLNNITFNGNACSSIGGEEGEVSSLLVSNAYYSSRTQEFRFCNGYLLSNDSEFMLTKVIAHELTHSIDPCRIGQIEGMGFQYSTPSDLEKGEKEYPIPNLVQCLRAKESVGASRGEWNRVQKIAPEHSEMSDYEKKQVKFCGGDQIGESVGDWMAAEVLPVYMSKYHPTLTKEQKIIGYSNVMRSYCSKKESNGISPGRWDEHPEVEDRINRILMANAKVRSDIGCLPPKDGLHYCRPGEPFMGTRVEGDMRAAAEKAEEKFKQNGATVPVGYGIPASGMGMPYPGGIPIGPSGGVMIPPSSASTPSAGPSGKGQDQKSNSESSTGDQS
jgi:hypothetical protein